MVKMSDSSFDELKNIYYQLSDFYFEVPEEETSQEQREKLNDACEIIMDVLREHSDADRLRFL